MARPRLVRASEAFDDAVPPLATATTPVTLAAVPAQFPLQDVDAPVTLPAIALLTVSVNLVVDWMLSIDARPSGAQAEL